MWAAAALCSPRQTCLLLPSKWSLAVFVLGAALQPDHRGAGLAFRFLSFFSLIIFFKKRAASLRATLKADRESSRQRSRQQLFSNQTDYRTL